MRAHDSPTAARYVTAPPLDGDEHALWRGLERFLHAPLKAKPPRLGGLECFGISAGFTFLARLWLGSVDSEGLREARVSAVRLSQLAGIGGGHSVEGARPSCRRGFEGWACWGWRRGVAGMRGQGEEVGFREW